MATYNITLTPNTDVDQTASLASQFLAIPNGTLAVPNIINMPLGRYRVDGEASLYVSVTWPVREHLRLTCLAGSSSYPNFPSDTQAFIAYTDKTGVQAGLSSRSHFGINGCTDVIGSFLAVDGPNLARDGVLFGHWSASSAQEYGFKIAAGGTNGLIASKDCGWEDCSSRNTVRTGYGLVTGTGGPDADNPTSARNCHLYRCYSKWAGQHGVTIGDVDGLEMVDVTCEWSARCGVDAEPNGAFQKFWNVNMTRCQLGGRLNSFQFGGANRLGPPKGKNIRLTDCTRLTGGIGLNAAGGGPSGNAGYFIVTGWRDTVNNSNRGMTISGYDVIEIDDAIVTTVVGDSIGVAASCRQSFTLTNSVLNGRTGTAGFTTPYTVVLPLADQGTGAPPPTETRYGNVWDMGTQNDGAPPGAPASGPIAQTLPSLRQAALGTSGSAASGAISSTLPSLTQAAAGTAAPLAATSFAVQSGQFAVAPFGQIQFADAGLDTEATIASTLPSLTQSALGTTGNPVSGGVVQSLPSLTQAATMAAEAAAIVASALPALTQSGTGSLGIDAIIAQTLPSLVGTGTGSGEAFGDVVSVLPSLTQAAEATMEIEATITSTLPSLSSQGQIFIGLLPTDRIPETRVVRVWSEYRSLKGASVPGKSWSR